MPASPTSDKAARTAAKPKPAPAKTPAAPKAAKPAAAAGTAAPKATKAAAKPTAKKAAPSAVPQPGMGAIPHAGGTTFRVWAPNADSVAVFGSFNEWNGEQYPLTHEDNGYWALDVAAAKPGDEYKFRIVNKGNKIDRNDPYARQVTNSAGSSVVPQLDFDWEEDAFQMPAWNELVIYELHVGTFNAKEGEVGTFQTVVDKLPYLRDMGINCIELLPATEFPGSRSWGYNPANPFALESDYGGPIGFKQLVKEAHRQGIAVVLDVVYNHFGPGDLDLWQFDGWSENDGGGIYFYNDWRGETPWGHNRPDYGRPEVRQYIRDNAIMWLTEYRVDGLRADAISFVRNVKGESDPGADLPDGWSLMRWVNEEIDQTMPWKITIAEDLRGESAITEKTEHGGQGFDSQWDGTFVYPIREVLTAPDDAGRNMHEVTKALSHNYNGDVFRRVIYTESHDEVANGKSRVAEEVMPGDADGYFAKKRAVLGTALVLTAPGVPMLFQGQEFVAYKEFNDNEPLRLHRAKENKGLVQLHRDLIRLRRNQDGRSRGLTGQHSRVFHVNNQDKVVAFARWADGQEQPGDVTVVLANFANTAYESYTIGLPAGGHWKVSFNSDWKGYDEDFLDFDTFDVQAGGHGHDGYPFQGSVALAPYAVVVLTLQG
ncbi:alpha-amylase family glycosyl hydrolase [Hymenobacter sp. ASUV-10]|uniref:1,4-alpha-glucan branching enzyme n=1 Tax=Hymenobacter aranciens TaxID=3063996 RepID=A0ABT9BBN1_9BACT|nr:alpha-amylase family glycosyl hydrolase [Hymenobacter sp. ASUV-10]MDO7875675.1 alpha-amylase family glycosyl hydrolase [Hymenobacter sp. ASUV-10]